MFWKTAASTKLPTMTTEFAQSTLESNQQMNNNVSLEEIRPAVTVSAEVPLEDDQILPPEHLFSDYIEITYLGAVIITGLALNFCVLRRLLREKRLAERGGRPKALFTFGILLRFSFFCRMVSCCWSWTWTSVTCSFCWSMPLANSVGWSPMNGEAANNFVESSTFCPCSPCTFPPTLSFALPWKGCWLCWMHRRLTWDNAKWGFAFVMATMGWHHFQGEHRTPDAGRGLVLVVAVQPTSTLCVDHIQSIQAFPFPGLGSMHWCECIIWNAVKFYVNSQIWSIDRYERFLNEQAGKSTDTVQRDGWTEFVLSTAVQNGYELAHLVRLLENHLMPLYFSSFWCSTVHSSCSFSATLSFLLDSYALLPTIRACPHRFGMQI